MAIPISRDNSEYDRVFGKDSTTGDFADGDVGTDATDASSREGANISGPSSASFGTDTSSLLGAPGGVPTSGMGGRPFFGGGMNFPNPFGFAGANPALAAQQQMFNDPYYFFAWPTWTSGFWGNTPSDYFAGASPLSMSSLMNVPTPFGGALNPQFPSFGQQLLGGPGQLLPSFTNRLPLAADVAARSAAVGGPLDTAWSTRDIAKVFPRHVGSRVMIDENGETIWRPSADIFETDNEILVHVDLPGVPKEEVHCDVRGADLIIWGEHKTPYEAASSRVRERNIGKFRKIVTLPLDQVESDKIEAKCENGLLEVKIPKKPDVKGKRISILWPE